MQQTIAQEAVVRGVGYWSGRDIEVCFKPAEADTGIVFVRGDRQPPVYLPVQVDNRVEVPRRTALEVDDVGVEMIEHIMAALAGLNIDNCQVWVDAAEMPGCDGSSIAFVEALDTAGLVTQQSHRRQLIVTEPIRLGNAESWVEALPPEPGQEGMVLEFHLDYGAGSPIGKQELRLEITPESFRRELANCRTFVLKTEADALLDQGLGSRARLEDLLVFGSQGPINNQLRHPDECARHKMLDMVGDLALAGCDLVGTFIGHRSGHRLNAALVRALCNQDAVVETH